MADNRKLRRKQIRKVREKLSDKEIFLSKPYHDALWKYAKSLGRKDTITLSIEYNEDPNSDMAKTDGRNIFLNATNSVTNQFPSREDKVMSHEGMVAHECGHIRFTDFQRRNLYINGFLQGLIYPRPPEVKSAADKRAWKEMKAYFVEKDLSALLYIQKTAMYLRNVLEDVYIEACICQEYPGSVSAAIQKNAVCLVGEIPTEKERKASGEGEISIMMDLIFRYARYGKTPEEDGYSKKYIGVLEKCRSIIDGSVLNPDPDSRLIATNWLMIKIWKYLLDDMKKAKQETEGLSDNEIRKKMQERFGQTCQWVMLSADTDGSPENKEEIEGWNGDPDGKPGSENQFPSTKGSDNTQKIEDKAQTENERESRERDKDAEKQKLFVFRSQIQNCQDGGEQKEEASGADGRDGEEDDWNLVEKMPEIQNVAAENKLNKTEERKLIKKLREEQKNLKFNEIHANVKMELHRTLDVSEDAEEKYAFIEPEIRKVSHRLQNMIEEILIRQEGGRLSGLYMGKRLDKNGLYRRDGKVFEKRIAPEEGISIAFAVLVDVSRSMDDEKRISYARTASLALYDFCRKLSVPVMVYGHSTHYPEGYYSKEVVDIIAYADFESVDGKDHLRIMEMKTIGSNRDGASLQFVGERLLKREEEIKILVLISDGSPAALGYHGEIAATDLRNIKRNLEKRGVKLFAAAIGDDKQQIEEIYQDGFLNISDLKTMPLKLASLLTRYI